jgi:amino acid transporter
VVAAGFAWSGSIALVAAVTNFTVYAVFIAVNLAVLRLRTLIPDAPRKMHAGPTLGGRPVAPILGIVATLVMVVFLDPTAWLVGGGLIVTSLIVWTAQRRITLP